MPVMEGKSILFKEFGDVDAISRCFEQRRCKGCSKGSRKSCKGNWCSKSIVTI